jgi:DNA-binding NarL/FixJ family response regulator
VARESTPTKPSQESPTPEPANIRVLIVEDHQIVAEGLVLLLSSCLGIEVVGAVPTVHQAIELADQRHPRVVLMDSRLPDGSGAEAAAYIHQRHPDIAIVFLSGYQSDDAVLAALEAGACGYLTKGVSGGEVLAAVRGAADGEMLVSSHRLASLISYQSERRARATEQTQMLDQLTAREREVLALLASGLDNREIASLLGISYATVRTHVRNLLEKIGAHTRLEAVLLAGEQGLLAPTVPECPRLTVRPLVPNRF